MRPLLPAALSATFLASLPASGVACSRSQSSGGGGGSDAALASVKQPPASAPLVDAAAPAPSAIPTRPRSDLNVVLLTIDSLRADMPWAGYPRPIAPRLTELEGRSVSYTRAYSISSYTSMSLGGLLGDRIPSELTRSGYFFGTYKNNVFFPKLLQSAGIHT